MLQKKNISSSHSRMVKMRPKNKPLEKRKNLGEKARECVAHEEPFSIKPSIKDFTKIDGNTTSYSINGIKANALMPVEEDVDLVLKILKLRELGQPHDELLLTTDRHLGTTKRMKIVSFSRMDCYSVNTTEKLVMSNTTIFSYQSI